MLSYVPEGTADSRFHSSLETRMAWGPTPFQNPSSAMNFGLAFWFLKDPTVWACNLYLRKADSGQLYIFFPLCEIFLLWLLCHIGSF